MPPLCQAIARASMTVEAKRVDEKLRELERAWRASGAAEDEAALLRERVRVGDPDEHRLALAAYLGHPAARITVDFDEPEPASLEDWIRGLEPWGRAAAARAGFALAPLAAPVGERLQPLVDSALGTAIAYLENAGRDQLAAADEAQQALAMALRRHELASGTLWPGRVAHSIARAATARVPDRVRVIETTTETPDGRQTRIIRKTQTYSALSDVLEAIAWLPTGHHDVAPTESDIRNTIRRALVPWALAGSSSSST